MPHRRSRPLLPTERANRMLDQDTFREATRLTQAEQLTEAKALLQRMFRGPDWSPRQGYRACQFGRLRPRHT
jgi:hypothetical protein